MASPQPLILASANLSSTWYLVATSAMLIHFMSSDWSSGTSSHAANSSAWYSIFQLQVVIPCVKPGAPLRVLRGYVP